MINRTGLFGYSGVAPCEAMGTPTTASAVRITPAILFMYQTLRGLTIGNGLSHLLNGIRQIAGVAARECHAQMTFSAWTERRSRQRRHFRLVEKKRGAFLIRHVQAGNIRKTKQT